MENAGNNDLITKRIKKSVGIIMQIQKQVPQCKMAWPEDGASWCKKQVEGWGPIGGFL
jgi:hypothetical protein